MCVAPFGAPLLCLRPLFGNHVFGTWVPVARGPSVCVPFDPLFSSNTYAAQPHGPMNPAVPNSPISTHVPEARQARRRGTLVIFVFNLGLQAKKQNLRAQVALGH